MPRTLQGAKRSTGGRSLPSRSDLITPRVIQPSVWSTASDESDDDIDAIPPFEMVSQNLAKIGAMTIERFLRSPTETDDFDIPYHIRENRETSPTPPPTLPVPEPQEPVKSDGPSKMQCVAQLHHTCQRVFGKTDMLKFEFIELDGPSTKRCILTITRPNGARRSYQTPGVYSRKTEAKAQTAALAIEMGAIDFISTGDADPSKTKKGLVLAPLDATGEGDSPAIEPEDPGVQEIANCCVEWRAGRVKPYWVALSEPKFGNKRGYALRIELSPHSIRVYSSETKYETIAEARAACAKVALDQNVLEFIKHGNGQVEPEKPPTAVPDADAQEAKSKATYAPSTPLTLQTFYETFPQPFPENFGDKSAVEINAPSWLNTTIQGARGGKLSTNFIWTTNGTLWGGNLGLHGCLLRLERPGESRSYLVDARFPKRADAKAAVCLQAISQGVGDYIRSIGQAMENKITPIMRRWANDLIFPMLGSECGKIKFGNHPRYDFYKEKDAYGCTMTLELSSFPTADETKTFTAPADYRTKADAKIALACIAAEQGAVEFLRFRGRPSPPDYQSFYSTLINGTAHAPHKRKSREDDGPQERKKSKMEGDRNVPLFESRNEGMAGLSTGHSSRPYESHDIRPGNNNGWKNPRGPASSGVGTISRPVQGPPIDQFRIGGRTESDVTLDYGAAEPPAPAVPPAPPRPGPQAHAVPPRPLRTGPVMLRVPGYHAPFTPAPQGRPGHGGPQAAPSQSNPYAPPPQPFPRAGQYPASGFSHAQIPTYYPPGNNIPHGMPPYALPQQYHGPVAGPSSPPAPPPPPSRYPPLYASPAPALPYGAQFPHYPPPPASHMYHSQHQPHSPYPSTPGPHPPNVPPAPAPNSGPDRTPGYGMPSAPVIPEQPPYNIQLHQPSHVQQSPTAPVPAQINKSTEEPPAIKSPQPNTPSKSLTDDMQISDEDTQLTITPAPVAKSHVASLFDHCTKEGVPQPKFHQKAVTDDSGKTTYKVWVIMGDEKLELPVTFATVNEGRERVAKQVLGRLRSQSKKDKS